MCDSVNKNVLDNNCMKQTALNSLDRFYKFRMGLKGALLEGLWE